MKPENQKKLAELATMSLLNQSTMTNQKSKKWSESSPEEVLADIKRSRDALIQAKVEHQRNLRAELEKLDLYTLQELQSILTNVIERKMMNPWAYDPFVSSTKK